MNLLSSMTIRLFVGSFAIALIISLIVWLINYPVSPFIFGFGLVTGFFWPGLAWSSFLFKAEEPVNYSILSFVFSILLMSIGIAVLNSMNLGFSIENIWGLSLFLIINGIVISWLKYVIKNDGFINIPPSTNQ